MNLALPADLGTRIQALHGGDEFGRAAAPALIRELFDRTFYLAKYPDIAAAGIEPLTHFLDHGLQEGRTPHALFDLEYYTAQMPLEAAGEAPLLHYLRVGAASGLDPHPLFDTAHYIAQTEARTLFGQLPLLHFLRAGTLAKLSPNPLFDAAYYRQVNGLGEGFPRHPLLHYLEAGWRERCRPHPLFDPAYYLTLRPDVAQAGIDPLAHYLRFGCRETDSTHALFDTAWYRAAFAGQPEETASIARRGAILHYLGRMAADKPTPCPFPLFDRDFYVERHMRSARSTGPSDPFLHFLSEGLQHCHDPHPLFDGAFYLSRYPDVAFAGAAPFLHFVRHGAREGRDPSPWFSSRAYLELHPEAAGLRFGALSHYLASTSPRSPSESFDADFYSNCLALTSQDRNPGHRRDALSHFLSAGSEAGLRPLPRPFAAFDWKRPGAIRAPHRTARPVLLISPGAAGQPVCQHALHALRQLASDPQIACNVGLLQDGSPAHEFAALAPTVLLEGAGDAVEILHAFARNTPEGVVILNSLAMPRLIDVAVGLEMRLIAWLHEMPVLIDSMQAGAASMLRLAKSQSVVVTSSKRAKTALCHHYGLQAEQVRVLAHGTERHADDNDAVRALSIAVREELGMPPDALLVLGGGAIDFLHGADLFIKVAQNVTRNIADHEPDNALAQACFVWVGAESDRLFAALCKHDVRQLDLGERFRFVTDPARMSQLLRVADLFLMTARSDASGADGMQASANGVPVIGFHGCADASGHGFGLVGYLDVEAMAERVVELGDRPARRGTRREASPAPRASSAADGPTAGWSEWHAGLRRILAEDLPSPSMV